MLGKLMNEEFKATAKTMGLTYIALAIVTLIGSFGLYNLQTGDGESNFNALFVILLGIYVIGIIAVYIISFVYHAHRYQKSMYGLQGYLTHTLPIGEGTILFAKLIPFFLWMVLSTLLSGVSVLIMVICGLGLQETMNILMAPEFWNDMAYLFNMPNGLFVLFVVSGALLSILYYILLVTTSLAIGQLDSTHKTGSAVLAAIGIYVVSKILDWVEVLATGYSTNILISDQISETESFNFLPYFCSTQIVLALFLALLIWVSFYINKNKLNLE